MRELDLSKEEDETYLKTYIIERLREKLVAREMFPVISIGTGRGGVQSYMNGDTKILVPVIHKEMTYNPETVESDIDKLVSSVAESEDRLLFSGETTDWNALGIEGLSTATGRSKVSASGAWTCPANLIDDLLTAKDMLGTELAILIIPWIMNRLFHETYWYPDSLDKEPLTVKNYLLKEKLVDGIVSTKNLYACDGGVDSVLLVTPGAENFCAVQDLYVEVKIWKNDEDAYDVTLRETIAPVIKNPESIVEIELIPLS